MTSRLRLTLLVFPCLPACWPRPIVAPGEMVIASTHFPSTGDEGVVWSLLRVGQGTAHASGTLHRRKGHREEVFVDPTLTPDGLSAPSRGYWKLEEYFAVEMRVLAKRELWVDSVTLSAGAATCSSGVEAKRLAVDGRWQWRRPIFMEGDHTLVVMLPKKEARTIVAEEGSTLDLVAHTTEGKPLCLRLPLTSLHDQTQWSDLGSSLWGFKIRGLYQAQPAQAGGFTFLVTRGRLLGPLRLSLEAGLGAITSDQALYAGVPHDRGNKGTLLLPVSAEAAIPVAGGRNWALFAAGAYELAPAMFTKLPQAGGATTSDWTLMHGPRLSLECIYTPDSPLVKTRDRNGPTGGFGVELSAAYQRWPGAPDATGANWVAGLALVGFWSDP